MKLIYWPVDDFAEAQSHELRTLEDLWQFVRNDLTPESPDDDFIRELSANEEPNGTPYLVLSWVRVEKD